MAKTIEEKAKAYDKALAKFRESLGKHDLVGVNRGYLESIFSELKESEDENIKNEIIDFIKNSHNYWQPNDSIAKKWVAWLEKQSEQKPEWSEEEKGNVDIIVSRLEVDIEYWESRSKRRVDEDKRVIGWLKSLKDRYTWKPTEEQIKALDYGIDDIKYCELGKHRIPILVGLLQQLKTL